MEHIRNMLSQDPILTSNIVMSVVIFLFLWPLKFIAQSIVKKKVDDVKRAYYWRHMIVYIYTFLLVCLIGRIWLKGFDSIATILGLATLGLSIAMRDTIANLAGWAFLIWRKPFKIGDRIQIGEVSGDVIDSRLFQFSLVEMGNWVDADQSTGRIVHVPNSKLLLEPLANYQVGFDYIWNEIPVLITFESNWKKAKDILTQIASDKAEHLSEGAAAEIRRAAMKFMIFYSKLTPIVYTSVKDSGVVLTIRYIVKPRQRRGSEQDLWEAILEAFSQQEDIDLAYPTTRFYNPPSTE